MKFEAVIQALRDGKKIQREGWGESTYLKAKDNKIEDEDGNHYDFSDEILEEDWQILKGGGKKYKVLFKQSSSSKLFDLSRDSYETLEEFNRVNYSNYSGMKGIKLVQETEEEFDV